MRKALFLDRDGILNKVVIREGVISSPRSLDEFEINEDARSLIGSGNRAGYTVVVVTNQPDVERNLLDTRTLEQMHDKLRTELGIEFIQVCTSTNDADPRRKPNPGMLLDAARELQIDLGRSLFVGDGKRDLAAGRGAGVTTILLKTSYNIEEQTIADHAVDLLDDVSLYFR
jgi:D-glycero-D-manno-heptose 1,7-bisphosphate phosphatase